MGIEPSRCPFHAEPLGPGFHLVYPSLTLVAHCPSFEEDGILEGAFARLNRLWLNTVGRHVGSVEHLQSQPLVSSQATHPPCPHMYAGRGRDADVAADDAE